MRLVNAFVALVLRSSAHWVLSGAVDVIRFKGARSGRLIMTPTQYARSPDGFVILVGQAERKQWWRNFREPRPAELLIQRRWLPVEARAVIGRDDPATAASSLAHYRRRFPRALQSEADLDAVVLVVCTNLNHQND